LNKVDVEELLGFEIEDDVYEIALSYAKRKQRRLLENHESKAPAETWYLCKLTEEYVHSILLSEATLDLCKLMHNIEKEHLAKSRSTPTAPIL
jgi:hypothetical protein